MKARAKARMKKRRDRFVVGYIGAGNTLFSYDRHKRLFRMGLDGTSCSDAISRTRARRLLAKMPCADCAIFELVPVEVNR